MLYLINTGITEQDSALLQELLAKFKKQKAEILRIDTEPEKQELEQIYLQLNNISFFAQPKVLVLNRIKLSKQLLELLNSIGSLVADVVFVGKAADKRSLKKILNNQKYTELKSTLTYKEAISQLQNLFKDRRLVNTVLPLINVSDQNGKRFYSQARLNLIKKWYGLLEQSGFSLEAIAKYMAANLDITDNIWQMLNVMFRLSTRNDFLYFEGLLTHRDPYEILNLLRTQLISLYWVKFLQQQGDSCNKISKLLGKNPFFIARLCEIAAKPEKILHLLTRLFELEFKVRIGEVSDIKEGFMLILASM